MIRLFLFSLLAMLSAPAATYLPSKNVPALEREFRGAWVAVVNNIDWPSRKGLTTEQQQTELRAIIDRCAQLKLNVVIFQVRPACDALYPSKLEPWSEYLTGTPGQGPHPAWDPLEFAIREAHARGMELHAWFNPFRARHSTGSKTVTAPTHVSKTRPQLVKKYGTHLWLDPGLAEVHDLSARVILDVVTRYDVDGIHVDDYFYPYPEKDPAKKEIPFPDDESFAAYQRAGGKLARDDWRRDNVNRFIARMYREVKAAKPWVKVGISPFGIYRPGHPAQIKGFDQYDKLYADPRAWLAQGSLDYLAPQLYWRSDAPAQSYPVLLKWWVENNPKGKMIVPGMNTHAVGTGTNPWPAGEILQQVALARQQRGAAGHIHWNMTALMRNRSGVGTELLRTSYTSETLPPPLPGSSARPATPKLSAKHRDNRTQFTWTTTGSDVRFWVVQYRAQSGAWHSEVLPASRKSFDVAPAPQGFAVRAVNRFGVAGEPASVSRAK